MTQAPDILPVPLADLISVAVEYWRLSTWLSRQDDAGAAPARHALRKLEQFLAQRELEVQSLDGVRFDPGLSVRVIDAIEDSSLPPGESRIDETLSPLVLWRGQVIRPAEVVTRKSRT